MANGLLDLLGGLGTTPPSYMEGLLGAQQTEDLRKQSIGTGLTNALIGYLAMPKNQNLGLGRILAGTAQAGIGGAQGVYEGATKDYLQAQQMAEAQRKINQQKELQTMIAGITDPQEKLFAQLAPEQWVANKTKLAQAESPIAKLNPKDYTPESWAEFIASKFDTTKLRDATVTKEKSMTEEPIRVAKAMFDKSLNELTAPEMQQVNDYIEKARIRVAGASVPSQQPTFKDATSLRQEYQALPTVKAFNEVNTAYNQIKTALTNPSPAGDLAGATKFMKLLDPTSVVRDTEMAMAMGATGLWDRVQNYYNTLAKGYKLTPDQRKDFMDSADRLYQVALQSKNAVENQYIDIANTGGLSPKLVVGSPTSNAALTDQEKARKIIEQRKGK